MEFLNKLVFFIFLILLGLIEAQSPSETKNIPKTKNSIFPPLFCLFFIRLLSKSFPPKKLQFVKEILTKPIQKLFKHFLIIKNFFASLKPHTNEPIQKLFTWRTVSYLLTFSRVLLCVGITFVKRFILVLGTFLIHSIQRFILALFKPFLLAFTFSIHSIQHFIHRLFKLFKLRDFFLSFVVVIQITVIVYRMLLHYKYV